MVLNVAALQRQEETTEERDARVRRLMQLVKSGAYDVKSHRLAMALLDWDPRRGAPRQSAEVADRRRAYMRAYMRRRRAQQTADDPATMIGAIGPPDGLRDPPRPPPLPAPPQDTRPPPPAASGNMKEPARTLAALAER